MKAIIQVNQDLDWSTEYADYMELNTIPSQNKITWTVMAKVDYPIPEDGITTGEIHFLKEHPEIDELLEMEFPVFSGYKPIMMCEVLPYDN